MEKEKLNEALQQALRKTDFMLRLNEKLEEYRRKRDEAKAICDKQEKFDTSFQAEVEDEIFLDAETQYRAIKDLYDYVTEELKPELKQTAVDYLAERYNYITWMRNRDEISAGTADEWRAKFLKEAKQMEKEQMFEYIKNLYCNGDASLKFHSEEFEQYYNETYGNEDKLSE